MLRKAVSITCLVGLVFSLLTVSACSETGDTTRDEVTVQLKWLHQTQFAGLYVAAEYGYYEEENLNVTFIEGGPEVDIVGNTLSGQADFLVASPEDLLPKRSEGAKLTAIAAIFRRSAVVFAAKKESGIVRPSDFTGKTISGTATGGASSLETMLMALLKKMEIDTNTISFIPYDPDYIAFINGEADITPAYYTNGIIKLRNMGEQLNLIWPIDYGIDFYSDLIVTTDTLITKDPDIVERFLRATLKGWLTALEDTDKAVDITMHYAPQSDKTFQTQMIEAEFPLIHTGEDHIGWMRQTVWKEMYDILLEQRIITEPFDYRTAFTMEFITDIYTEDLP